MFAYKENYTHQITQLTIYLSWEKEGLVNKKCSGLLAPYLLIMYKQEYKNSTFPQTLNEANITLIP